MSGKRLNMYLVCMHASHFLIDFAHYKVDIFRKIMNDG